MHIRLLGALFLGAAPLSSQLASLDSVEVTLRAGAAWHATMLLAPRLAAADGRTPEALIAAARAAAGWEGWGTVDRLLDGQDWIDTRFDRIGRRLLAESALAGDRASEALTHARASLPATVYQRTPNESGLRWILLGRAHERLTAWDSAASAYTRAATLLPDLADWLALRAAATTRDRVARTRLYATVTTPAARARVGWTEAQAAARFLDREGAAREYANVGAIATALRLRWEASAVPASRARVATELLALIRAGSPVAESRQAVELVVGYSIPLARSESLLVARRAVELGRPADGDRYYRALSRGARLAPAEMMSWGDAEAAQGKWEAAARSYRTITTGPLAGRAAYLAARAALRGGGGSPVAELSRIPSRFPADTYAAGNALYLLGDLALDANRPDSARRLFRTLAERYPTGEFAERAALVAPLIAFARGEFATARQELEAAIARGTVSGLAADAGRYWLARSIAAQGDRELANARFRVLLERGPENYYAIRAAVRLGVSPWRFDRPPVPPTDSIPPPVARARHLAAVGLLTEARHELDRYAADATTANAMLAAGWQLLAAGHPSRATRLAQRAVQAGAPRTAGLLGLLYPLPFAVSLRSAAARVDLDPWLAAAVIRQESAFEPRATSAVGARGLMQVMPANGPRLARTIDLNEYDPALLYQPEVNLAMGTRHLAEALRRYPDLERALAAYNAGGSRVARWNGSLLDGRTTDAGPFDLELYVERIPYLETRGYVRNIFVNREMYRLLYE